MPKESGQNIAELGQNGAYSDQKNRKSDHKFQEFGHIETCPKNLDKITRNSDTKKLGQLIWTKYCGIRTKWGIF